jgi:hypothetical protein
MCCHIAPACGRHASPPSSKLAANPRRTYLRANIIFQAHGQHALACSATSTLNAVHTSSSRILPRNYYPRGLVASAHGASATLKNSFHLRHYTWYKSLRQPHLHCSQHGTRTRTTLFQSSHICCVEGPSCFQRRTTSLYRFGRTPDLSHDHPDNRNRTQVSRHPVAHQLRPSPIFRRTLRPHDFRHPAHPSCAPRRHPLLQEDTPTDPSAPRYPVATGGPTRTTLLKAAPLFAFLLGSHPIMRTCAR